MIYVLNAYLSLWLRQFEGLHTNLSGSIKAITCASRENGKSMKNDHQHKKRKIQKNDTKYKILIVSIMAITFAKEGERGINEH